MVNREGQLQLVLVHPALPPGEHGGVVDQHVETLEASQVLLRHPADLPLGSEIGNQQVERIVAAQPFDLRHGLAAAGFAAA